MSRRRRLWLLLPRELRALPADLAAVALVVVATNVAVFLPVVRETPLRVVIGLVFVLFAPGYAFVAALFPEAGEPPTASGPPTAAGPTSGDADHDADGSPEAEAVAAGPPLADRGIDGVERVALSFGLSIAIVPLLGLALNFTPFGIRLVPVIATVSAFTLGACAVAAVRRWDLPPEERFRVPYRRWLADARAEVFEPDDRVDAALNVALALAVLLATSSVVYAVAVPPEGEEFTEFYVLSQDGDEELVAADYPETLVADEPETLHVGVGNHESETVDYEVVVQLHRVEGEANDSRVVEREAVDRWSVTVADNETWLEPVNVTVSGDLTGEDLRLTFLLYDGDVPDEPTRANAYRDLHLWVDVVESGSESEA